MQVSKLLVKGGKFERENGSGVVHNDSDRHVPRTSI